jgi:hypothetical protein
MEEQVRSEGAPMDQPRRGWFGRNWLWFVPTIIVVPVLLCGGCCGGIFLVVVGGMKKSEVYKTALEQVQNDPKVIAALGEPIEAGWMVTGEVNVQAGGGGDAKLYFPVSGPRGKAGVTAEARRVGGTWGLIRLEVATADGQKILLDVAPEGEAGGEGEAPRFDP